MTFGKNFESSKLQRRAVLPEQILSRIVIGQGFEIPNIILAIAPCRSGTTAMLRVFAQSGIPAVSQPFKTIHRQLAKGQINESTTWSVPPASRMFIKETIGPFGEGESTINILNLVVQLFASFKPLDCQEVDALALARKHLHIIIMGRHPLDTWHSWVRTFEDFHTVEGLQNGWYYQMSRSELLTNFLLSYQSTEQMALYAERCGIPLSYYVYEANLEASKAMTALFLRLGIRETPQTNGWGSQSLLGHPGSLVSLPGDHSTQFTTGIFRKVNNSSGLVYFAGSASQLPTNEKMAITEAGIEQIYEKWRYLTFQNIRIKPSQTIQGAVT